jgi:PAS domain S-box-containing protein
MAIIEERRFGSNTVLRAVIDTTVDGMIIVDRTGTMKVFNHAAEKLFGYSAEEVVGRNVSILMPPDAQLRPGVPEGNFHESGRRKDGTVFPIDLAVGEVTGGGDLAYVGIIRDLTDKERNSAALTAAKARAELASDAKSEFLARMSHELRTPMNAIMGFTQLLQMTPKEAISVAQHADYLASILGPAEHLAAMIDDILDVVQIMSGRTSVSLKTVALPEIIEQAVADTMALSERSGISLLIEPGTTADPPRVWADPLRLRQCLVNLLSNAIKYSRPGDAVRITISSWQDSVRVTVADSGIGIPPDQLGDLFEPFKRLHQEHEEIEGIGIGLALVKQLIEAMHGLVSAENVVIGGARFHIDLCKASTADFPRHCPKPDSSERITALARPAPRHHEDRTVGALGAMG